MRVSRTLTLYVLREVVQYTALGVIVLTTLLLSRNLIRTLTDFAGAGIPAADVLRVLAHMLPVLATYAFPLAFLFGVLLAMGRLSGDSEVTAMRACGVGLGGLVAPVLAFALLVAAGTAWLMIDVEPAARKDLRYLLRDVASRTDLVEPGRFKGLGNRIVFVRDRDSDDNLSGVVIWDRSNADRPFVVFAESGRVQFDRQTAEVRFQLRHGDVHLEPAGVDDPRYQTINFETFDYAFDIGELLDREVARLRPRDMSMQELRAVLARARAGESLAELREDDPNAYEVQIQRRLALPAAPLFFALIGVPLGLRRSRNARSWGALVCVGVGFSYYALLSFAEHLAGAGRLPSAAALWLPNAAFLAAAVPLLLRARRGAN